ncbi:hypothetical protein D4Z93_03410 [Clostridium fermenticellae]|uniref:J domain-containing protein n=1 Tax=Clostridium fermenticellae TaxID=2068654 RepID=A0A386H232_9CLOT|nr:hypothetical protein [Clostridium fermenticellae]AYD39603.1 hypothetical protein D4Z93_03320 [Clostridium fermenticellae]AYD39618.1 hypothetical protein D4Z93_03410 [Clostridium fermenticellae]
MYCVIQKVFNKKCNSLGEAKELKVDPFELSIDGVPQRIRYYYTYSEERFQRTHREAFKISIHESYREDGKVKKKQWVICTISYYDIVDGWSYIGDHIVGLDDKLKDIGITEDELYNMVYKKFDPIIAAVEKEYKGTDEYKAKKKHKRILDKYRESKNKFEKKYGQDTYDYCYDVFGVLRNKEYLKELQDAYKANEEFYSSYYDNFKSNYSSNNSSSYFDTVQSNYTEDEKVKLKKIYKVLALKFHPDMNNGDADMMKFVNKLKEEWGI